MLKQTYIELTNQYSSDHLLIEKIWHEIETAYTHKKRFYHTLDHLANLFNQLIELKNQISDWQTVLFAIYFHDLVYNVLKSNNEERSASLAKKRMASLAVPTAVIEKCKALIIATKMHASSSDQDVNIFTDADLSILGVDQDSYSTYCQQIRMEYSMYPDFMYNGGRKKVLTHFLQMERIFKTDHFYSKFESQARRNLQFEFNKLV